mmetsp:Transcript_111533/g.322391  ORF Transcript_111533/g.322391 Transcript_111533/m.322391 type:complete len:381 (+) Transcript_111533:960-2102(+)
MYASVVHLRQAELELWLVVARPLVEVTLPILHAALHGPLEERAIADLGELPVLGQELVQPLEGALIGQADGYHNLVLAVLGCCRCLLDLTVVSSCLLEGQALEGQGSQRARTEADLHSHISVGHRREQGLATQALGQRLRLRHALAITKQADCAGVRAGGIEVQQHGHDLTPHDGLRDLLPLATAREEALAVEAHAALPIAQQDRGLLRREAHAHQTRWVRAPSVATLRKALALHDHRLEHVAATFQANAATSTGQQVLEPALAQAHQVLAGRAGQDVQRRVLRVEHAGVLQLGTLHRGGVCLLLRHRLGLLRGLLLDGLLRSRHRLVGLLPILLSLLHLLLLRLVSLLFRRFLRRHRCSGTAVRAVTREWWGRRPKWLR